MLDVITVSVPTDSSGGGGRRRRHISGAEEEEKKKENEKKIPQLLFQPQRLGTTFAKVRIRARVTVDGGRSRFAVDV
jgi:hypothetical protein